MKRNLILHIWKWDASFSSLGYPVSLCGSLCFARTLSTFCQNYLFMICGDVQIEKWKHFLWEFQIWDYSHAAKMIYTREERKALGLNYLTFNPNTTMACRLMNQRYLLRVERCDGNLYIQSSCSDSLKMNHGMINTKKCSSPLPTSLRHLTLHPSRKLCPWQAALSRSAMLQWLNCDSS